MVNGEFETGNFSGWTTTDAASGSYYFVSLQSHSGAYSAAFAGNTIGSYDTIQQTLPTLAGVTFNLSFYLFQRLGGSSADFQALWDDVVVYDSHGPNMGAAIPFPRRPST